MRPTAAAHLTAISAGLLVALAACSAEVGSTSPPPPASEAGSPAPQPPSIAFTFPEGEVPVVSREQAGSQEDYINPGAVIEHDGQLHMYANVFTAWPGRVEVKHLASDDGVAWSLVDPAPVLTSDDVAFAEPGIDVSTGFVDADGQWVLIFETVSLVEPWVIGRATAPGPDGPWTVDPEPILGPGEDGSFDAGGLSWPSVVPTDDGWAMYYTAIEQPNANGVIAMATSTDGVAWTKADAPVLEPVPGWERASVDRPRVVATPGGLVMVYAGGRLTDRGIARSDDGVTWTRDGQLPAITREAFPISGNAWDAALVYREGALHYYLEIGLASGTSAATEIYRAVSPL